MKQKLRLFLVEVVVGASACMGMASSYAQSSVTLFGIMDNGITYSSNETSLGKTSGGQSNFKMSSAVWLGSQFGLVGTEDIGGGTFVNFKLASRFNSANGAAQYSGAEFGQQAYVGVSNQAVGSVTLGRVYTSYYWTLQPFSPTNWLSGFTGAHPGDIDNMDTDYKTNNSIAYTTPTWAGITASAGYSLGGTPGCFSCGASWSAGIRYKPNAFGIAVAIERFNNSSSGGGAWGADSTASAGAQQGVSALTNGFQTAAAQQRFAVAGGYAFSPSIDVTFTYSNVQYIPGINSSFKSLAVWNTVGVAAHYQVMPAVDVAGGYSLTRATTSNGISDSAKYQQVSLAQYYSLSKRTGIYLVEAYQRASGKTLGTNGTSVINATAAIGDGFNSAPSATGSQIVTTIGIVQRF